MSKLKSTGENSKTISQTSDGKGMKVSLGSGIEREAGFLRVDIDPKVNPDYCINIEKAHLPFATSTVDVVHCNNILEHLRNIDYTMEEIWRVLKPNGKLKILVPHYRNYNAYYDPDHIRYFTENSMIYWCRDTLGSDGRPVVRGDMDFKVVNITTTVNKKALDAVPKNLQKLALDHWWNICEFITFEMVAVKPARNPYAKRGGKK